MPGAVLKIILESLVQSLSTCVIYVTVVWSDLHSGSPQLYRRFPRSPILLQCQIVVPSVTHILSHHHHHHHHHPHHPHPHPYPHHHFRLINHVVNRNLMYMKWVKRCDYSSHIITKLIATLLGLHTTNQEVSATEINSFRNESLVFPTPKVVANISPIRQKRLKDMLTVADNFMKQLVFSVFKHTWNRWWVTGGDVFWRSMLSVTG